MRFPTSLAAAVAAGALLAAGCGDDGGAAPAGESAKATGNPTDRAFAGDMIPHHESAVDMAEIAEERGESDFVKQLAEDIVASQTQEIATLREQDEALAAAGVKKGSLGVPEHMMGMGHDVAQLERVEPFDEAFIRMMVPHHRGAIEMAKVELEKGADPELTSLAQAIIGAQQREIEEMTEHLGGDAEDPGHH